MSDRIYWECNFLIVAFAYGMFLFFVYDLTRIFRRVWIHKSIVIIAVEDFVFWIFAGVTMFYLMYIMNKGAFKGIFVLGALMGAAIYYEATKGWFVKYFSKILKILIKPLKNLLTYSIMKQKTLIKKGMSNEKVRDKAEPIRKDKKAEKI